MSIITYSDVDFQVVPFGGLAGRIRDRFGPALAGMYDFTSPEGLYQDASGTTPVTAYDQPIGLALDRRFGLERIAIGDVASATLSGDVTRDAEGIHLNGMGQISTHYAEISGLVAGRTYELLLNYTTATGAADESPVLQGGTGTVVPDIGPSSRVFTAAQSWVRLTYHATLTTNATVTEFSIREVPGHHLTQSTTPARPRFTAQGALHDGVDDFLQAALADDWTFLHDGSGGTLGLAGLHSGDGAAPSAGTQSVGGSSNGASIGLQSASLARSRARVSNGTEPVIVLVSETGSVPLDDVASQLLSFSSSDGAELRVDGVLESAEGQRAPPSTAPPFRALRTRITPAGMEFFCRRIIAIREAVTDPADIALIDAWLREGA